MSKFSRFNNWRRKQRAILIVGALGTGLEARHVKTNNNLWSASALISAPEQIVDVNRVYFNCGANITCTDTYQATPKGFENAGYTKDDAKHYVKLAVKLAEKGRDLSVGRQTKFISGDMGPYGAYLHDGSEYTGDYDLTTRQFINFHLDRFRWLADSNCDLIEASTIPNFHEIKALCQIFKQRPDIPVILTCTLKDGHHIADGTDLRKVQDFLEKQPTITGYGMNCFPPKFAISAIKYLKAGQKTDQDIIVFPNAGSSYNPHTKQWGKSIPRVFSKNALKWHQYGAKAVGGCCEISEPEISRVHRELTK